MTELTRRSLLGGIGAVSLAHCAITPVRAAAPQIGKQAPGWYRYKLGSFEITVVTDGVNRFKLPDDLVSNVKREDVSAALVAARMDGETFSGPYNPIVVNTGQKLVLIDTGTGEASYHATKQMS